MMRYGIPAYRLPRDVLDAEIGRILALGVELECGARSRTSRGDARRAYDAVFLAVGAHVGRHARSRPGAPRGSSTPSRCCTARGRVSARSSAAASSSMAVATRRSTPPAARRLARAEVPAPPGHRRRSAGSRSPVEPTIIYRRTRERMPAQPEELEQAEERDLLPLALDDRGRRRRAHQGRAHAPRRERLSPADRRV